MRLSLPLSKALCDLEHRSGKSDLGNQYKLRSGITGHLHAEGKSLDLSASMLITGAEYYSVDLETMILHVHNKGIRFLAMIWLSGLYISEL